MKLNEFRSCKIRLVTSHVEVQVKNDSLEVSLVLLELTDVVLGAKKAMLFSGPPGKSYHALDLVSAFALVSSFHFHETYNGK